VDYANGVREAPTPVDVLTQNMVSSKDAFAEIIELLLLHELYQFNGFVYRFE